MVEVQREHRIGERRVDVHNVTDHKRCTFMPAQHTGGKRPSDLQLTDVVRVDLVEFGIALVVVGDRWHHHIRRVRLHLHQIAALCIGGAEHEW